jgi:hypothetical protein
LRAFIWKPWRGPLAHRAILRASPSAILLVAFELTAVAILLQAKSDVECLRSDAPHLRGSVVSNAGVLRTT